MTPMEAFIHCVEILRELESPAQRHAVLNGLLTMRNTGDMERLLSYEPPSRRKGKAGA
jgi:hypothetical protein